MLNSQREDNILNVEERRRFRLDNTNTSEIFMLCWKWCVFLQISICCPASSSGQAAYNSKSTIVILSCFCNMQFEIRAGGGRKGLEEAKTQTQIAQSANLILNPYLVVPITAPQTSV